MFRGIWVAWSVGWLTLDFCSGRDLRILGSTSARGSEGSLLQDSPPLLINKSFLKK